MNSLTVLVPVKDFGDDQEFNAKAAIEVLIYALDQHKLADANTISNALLWWSNEVFEVLPDNE